MEKNRTKRVWLALFYAACLIAVLAFVGYHMYNLMNSDVVTVRATESELRLATDYVAYVARDEASIGESDLCIMMPKKSGSRFISGDECIYAYSHVKRETIDRMETLRRENALLELAREHATLDSSESSADQFYRELMDKLSSGELDVGSAADSLFIAQSAKDFVFDKDAIKARIAENEKSISELETKLGAPEQTFKAPFTGYVFAGGDNYGDVFNSALAKNGSADDIISAISTYNADESVVHKVGTATKYAEWYILIPTDVNDAKRYTKGREYQLSAENTDRELTAYLEDVRQSEDMKSSVLVFSLSTIPSGTEFSRAFRVSVVVDEFDGYRIPFSALRSDRNGVNGVYVMSGGVVLFRKVEIIKSGEAYVFVKSYDTYMKESEAGKTAGRIYGSLHEDSIHTGIYPGGPYASFSDKNDIYDGRFLVKDPFGDTVINAYEDSVMDEYGYLEENELVIIEGNRLYHGKIQG